MTRVANEHSDRLVELLADRATQGLPVDEERELADLLRGDDDESFDWAAAATDRALFAETDRPAPPSLVEKLRADAEAYFNTTNEAAGERPIPAPIPISEASERSKAPRRWAPWLVAAAAVVVAAVSWWGPAQTTDSPVERRAELIASADDEIVVPWSGEDGLSGDIVWSPSQQTGFMRFRGLASNDPRVEQYQLWIFDAERDERFPVDGGVFDIPADGGEVVVPIDPRIPVGKVTLFAVTIEEPGGVVVSDRERIAAVAPVDADT